MFTLPCFFRRRRRLFSIFVRQRVKKTNVIAAVAAANVTRVR
jgi:hypothetical protein